MYVKAPRMNGPGTAVLQDSIYARVPPSTGLSGFATEDGARNSSPVMNQVSTPQTMSRTNRSNMQSGILGYRLYRETSYGCEYSRWDIKTSGGCLLKSKVKPNVFETEYMPLGIGYAGFFQSGINDTTTDVNPSGTNSSIQAIYNRAVIGMLQRRADVECKQKMLDTKLDMAETLVDIDKTALLLARRATQVLHAWRSVRNGNYKLAAKHLGISRNHFNFDSAAKAWLELQYGWLPLLSDIFGAVEQVKKTLATPSTHARVRRRVKEELYMAFPTFDYNKWKDAEYSPVGLCEVEVQLRFRIADSTLAYLSGLNLTNPLYIFWVSMPFTFVVDWLLPIGDWLNSLTAPLGLTFEKGYRTTKCYGKMQVSASRLPQYPAAWELRAELGRATSTAERMYMNRVSYTGFPMSWTYFRLPFSSPQRLASAVALIHQTSKLR